MELQLVGFIIEKFVTMHGHMNVKFVNVTVFTGRLKMEWRLLEQSN